MTLVPISLREANAFVLAHHRHSRRPIRGARFCVGLRQGTRLVGVAIAHRPLNTTLDDGYTLEVARVCTLGERNACSRLYGAIRRAAKALGYRRLVTYTLASEPGTSPAAAGFRRIQETRGNPWRTRAEEAGQVKLGPDAPEPRRVRWELVLSEDRGAGLAQEDTREEALR